MSSRHNDSDISDLAYVDADGRYIDGADYSFVNLRFPRLLRILREMAEGGKKTLRLDFPSTDLKPLVIERLDPAGRFWKAGQDGNSKKPREGRPSVRFFLDPVEGIIRPVDYRDPYVTLDGNSRTSQLLIASFMMHWLSALLAIYADAPGPAAIDETGDIT